MALTHTARSRLPCLLPRLRQLTSASLTSDPVCMRSRSSGLHQQWRHVRGSSAVMPSRQISVHPSVSSASSAAPAASKKADKPLRFEGDAKDVEVHSNGKLLSVTWQDGQVSNFHSLWLRYSCHCEQCLEEHTGQRLYLCENLDPDVSLQSVQREGEDLLMEFGGSDRHQGRVPIKFLKEYDYSSAALLRKKAVVEVNTYAKEVPELTYADLTQREDGLYRWLKNLADYGFCVVKGVPTEEFMVLKMAEMIGPIQDTIYDDVFDVHVSDHQLTNVAYSADGLVYHQDLLYYESPPGLQFLHTLKFDDCVTGGESLIVDAFKVAKEFCQSNPADFEALATIPATFQKIHYGSPTLIRKAEDQTGWQRLAAFSSHMSPLRPFWSVPVHLTFSRPLITLNQDKQIVGVFWEPAHEGPIEVPEHQVEAFYRAHIAFAQAVKNAPTQFEWRMEEGDLLSFNNRRVCHSRNGFVMNGGTRHLKGCYVNIDHFKSRLMVLSQKFNNGNPSQRVGNQCMF